MLSEKAIRRLASTLSTDLGFSIEADTLATLFQRHDGNAAEIVRSIFRKEEMDPDLVDRALYRRVRDAIHGELSASMQQPGGGT